MKRFMLAFSLALALSAGGIAAAEKPSIQDVLRATFAVHDKDYVALCLLPVCYPKADTGCNRTGQDEF